MARLDLTAEEMRILRAALAKPAEVCRMLDDVQYEACAGILRFPDLAAGCTAHLFDSPNTLYGEVFRAVKHGATGLDAVYFAVSRRQKNAESALPLAALDAFPVTRWNAARAIAQLKRFVAWQYRQEKARRNAA